MRDIKFRAWRKELERFWFFDISTGFNVGNSDVFSCVEQFTGLTDKNGVDIYEGDIVYLSGYGDYKVEFPFLELYEAVMENDIGEIKGNTHQNPELIHN